MNERSRDDKNARLRTSGLLASLLERGDQQEAVQKRVASVIAAYREASADDDFYNHFGYRQYFMQRLAAAEERGWSELQSELQDLIDSEPELSAGF